ncbi:beta-glucuronidase [Bulleidia sp. zg-1006]|uniref:beta-glucuronidase n=1 Tax=Bulleidia sp. zg-1006 TaxID=2806552 RepID=UPI00193A7859|nr:beta-glucuronidase [Bulleidia sp. zg-1006]QRG87091.1 beta-glucuronidase [Bulleidia sp. zg-1006]
MLQFSELYPVQNQARHKQSLNGLWKFSLDPNSIGDEEKWKNGLKEYDYIPVPASFNDLYTDKKIRDYVGDFWYETSIFYHQSDLDAFLRFGSVTHRCEIFVNGEKVGEHEGGFLPVVVHVKKALKPNANNTIVVKVNNSLSEASLPCGAVKYLKNGRPLVTPYFDFFNYAGIHRNVDFVEVPNQAIQDYETSFTLENEKAIVHYSVRQNSDCDVLVTLFDAGGKEVSKAKGEKSELVVDQPILWQLRNAYLYTLQIQLVKEDTIIDEYSRPLGIRSIEIKGETILLNGKKIYLKGFGKHEDAEVFGRGFNYPIIKRDFELMKWSNANSFRTSHYPYAEEWYDFADQEGFLIMDEVPAVGMMRSTRNAVDAGSGKVTNFFQTDTVPALLKNHLMAVEEMIQRDKNHPSVIAYSLFNEPETTTKESYEYFKKVFEFARSLDKTRPLTGAFEKNSAPELDYCHELCDFICLNRYYGWYISGGAEMEDAEVKFRDEMNRWQAKKLNKPFVFTEFGTDTLGSEHKLPSVMWSQEYQNEYYQMNFQVFDDYEFVQGELTWNFADFQTGEGVFRVNGNKKGVFTRNRQPKEVAFILKKRWEEK